MIWIERNCKLFDDREYMEARLLIDRRMFFVIRESEMPAKGTACWTKYYHPAWSWTTWSLIKWRWHMVYANDLSVTLIVQDT